MKKIFLAIMFVVLNACGGGGGSDNTPASSSSPTPTPSSSTLTTRVIDGYIDGANTFIDYNYNFVQDPGEPSATNADCEGCDGSYYFVGTSSFFSEINNWSVACSQSRIQISEVPVGAIDANLGEVTEAFTMFYIPYKKPNASESNIEVINVTPFTGLFLDFVTESKDELDIDAIEVADGCGEQANALATSVNAKAATFAIELQEFQGDAMEDLYSNYIETNNNQQAQLGEKIVDFMKAADDVRDVVNTHYNDEYNVSVSLSEEAIDQLYGPNDFTDLPISLYIHHKGNEDSDGWAPTMLLHTSGLKLLKNSKIASVTCTEIDANNCTLFDVTYENIINNLDWYLSYGGNQNTTLIDGITIQSDYRQAKYHEKDGGINCQKSAQLKFYSTKTCNGDNCPTSIGMQPEITHNYGFEPWSGCTIFDNPYLYIFTNQINKTEFSTSQPNGDDSYGIQYSLKPGSAIYSNPPVNFLGADKNTIGYQVAYNKIKDLHVNMDNIGNIAAQMIDGEFISMERRTRDANEKGLKKIKYSVSKGSNGLSKQCKEYPWNDNAKNFDHVNPIMVEGDSAFSACYNFVNAFDFHNE